MEKTSSFSTRKLTVAALCGALAFVLMLFKVNIPMLSPVADLDLSAFPELIGGFMLGPVAAIEIIAIKLLLKLLFVGTNSMFTGELQNFILSAAYVLPAVLYYRKNRTKKGAVQGVVIGSVFSVIAAIFTNIYIIFPFYMKLYEMDWAAIIGMFGAVNASITSIPAIIAFSIVPFNIISRLITSLMTVLLYKKISVPLKKMIG